MYTNNRDTYRQTFFNTWDKYLKKLALEPVEAQLIEIILLHPEYQSLLEKPKQYQTQEFTLEENPFVHMSLHLAIQEQINTDRPKGIRDAYQNLIPRFDHPHDALHFMMDCLAKLMWEAQQTGEPPKEEQYIKKLSCSEERRVD